MIWAICLIIKKEGVHEHFKYLQIIGFVLLVFGTLLFNEIIILPILDFDQNTAAAKARKQKQEHLLEEGDDEDL